MKCCRDPKDEAGNHYDSLVLTAHGKLNVILNSGPPPLLPGTLASEPQPSISGTQDPSTADSSFNESTIDTEVLNFTQEEEVLKKSVLIMKQGTRFLLHLFCDVIPEEVDYVSGDINGLKMYKIKCTTANYSAKTSNRRWLKMNTSSQVGLNGIKKNRKLSRLFCLPNQQLFLLIY